MYNKDTVHYMYHYSNLIQLTCRKISIGIAIPVKYDLNLLTVLIEYLIVYTSILQTIAGLL